MSLQNSLDSENPPEIVVLYGGTGPERAIALHSGESVARAIEMNFSVQKIDLASPEIPAELDPSRCVIFPVFHGGFGENGQLQALLEQRGFSYVGSGAQASHACMNKHLAKRILRAHGIPMAPEIILEIPGELSTPAAVIRYLGPSLVVKPVNSGSTLGVQCIEGADALRALFAKLEPGTWMIEPRIRGRDLTVGILRGKAMEIIEIRPESGFYDYHHKYTKGATEYLCPAPLPVEVQEKIKSVAVAAFQHCGCRDFGRVDFMLSDTGELYFLEINTIPGISSAPTSLFPRSVRVATGMKYEALIMDLLELALYRFKARWAGNVIPSTAGTRPV